VTLIDTPGFDDSGRDDGEILKTIGIYLKAAYAKDILLRGVIYLHRITDNRMQGSSLRSLAILKSLCGPENYNNIALATTMWSAIVDPREGDRREGELKTHMDYWAGLIAAGAKVYRHDKEERSAKEMVRQLLPKQKIVLQFQRELLQHGVIGKTSAGSLVKHYLEEMQRKYEARISHMKNLILELESERNQEEATENKLREEISKMTDDIKRLDAKIDPLEEERARESLEKTRIKVSNRGWSYCVTQ
jgi:hypothetical protein